MSPDGILTAGLKLVGAALSLAIYVGFARVMPPAMFGELVLLLAAYAIATAAGSFGTSAVALRFVSEAMAASRVDLAAGAMRFALGTALSMGGLVAIVGVGFVLLGDDRTARPSASASAMVAMMIVPGVLGLALAGVLQGLHRVMLAEILMNIVRTLALALPVAWVWWQARTIDIEQAAAWNLVATAIACAALAIAIATVGRTLWSTAARYDFKRWLGFAGSLSLLLVLAACAERLDLLLLGALAGAEQTAIYGAASRCVQVLIFAINAIGAMAAPRIAAFASDMRAGQGEGMQNLLCSTARTVAGVALVAFIAAATLGRFVLELFGAIYVEAYDALLILVAGQFVGALFGPGAVFATFIGETRIVMATLVGGMLVNAALNLALVPLLGIQGTALAVACTTIAMAAGLWFWARRRFAIRIDAIVTFRVQGDRR